MLIIPLTSKTNSLLAGEFLLANWMQAGLNVESAVKRGIYTVQQRLIAKSVGKLSHGDAEELERSLRNWLSIS